MNESDSFSTALVWLEAGHSVAIATVISTWGSAPRVAGSHLFVRADGLFTGSVSGGCIEGEVIAEAQALLASPGIKRLDYGISDAMAWEVGLACGGRISVLVQPVRDEFFPIDLLHAIVSENMAGRPLTISTDMANGMSRTWVGSLPKRATEAAGYFLNPYFPPRKLVISGAVHIAQALAPMAMMAGYTVRIIDPRTAFANPARFVGVDLETAWPDEALAALPPDSQTAVVALSHDPKLDDPALIAALNSPAFYIAALGSRKNHASRLERLALQGFDAETLARIHGPAGLPIGAVSPAEIAVSILAQMTATLHGV